MHSQEEVVCNESDWEGEEEEEIISLHTAGIQCPFPSHQHYVQYQSGHGMFVAESDPIDLTPVLSGKKCTHQENALPKF